MTDEYALLLMESLAGTDMASLENYKEDVPVLIAEIRRLKAENEWQRELKEAALKVIESGELRKNQVQRGGVSLLRGKKRRKVGE